MSGGFGSLRPFVHVLDEDEHGQTQRCFLRFAGSSDRLHVRSHDVGHSADLGGLVDFVHCGLLLLPAVFQGLDGNVHSYGGAEFETIHYRFGR